VRSLKDGCHEKRIVVTVSYVVRGNDILLYLRNSGIGQGLWNGFGGHVGSGETVEQAAAREFREESGLTALKQKKVGIGYVTIDGVDKMFEIHFFLVTEFEGKLQDSDEMIPMWLPMERIPYSQMWPSDRHALPIFLHGGKCICRFHLQQSWSWHWIRKTDKIPDGFDLYEENKIRDNFNLHQKLPTL